MNKLKRIFTRPKTIAQRQYEALRALIIDETPAQAVAKKYGYALEFDVIFIHYN